MSPFMTLTLILLQMMIIIIVVVIALPYTRNITTICLTFSPSLFNSENSGSGRNMLAKTTHSHSVYLEIYFSKVLKSHCVPSKHNNFSLLCYFCSKFKMLVHWFFLQERSVMWYSRDGCVFLVDGNSINIWIQYFVLNIGSSGFMNIEHILV